MNKYLIHTNIGQLKNKKKENCIFLTIWVNLGNTMVVEMTDTGT